MTEADEAGIRSAILAEARSWLRTPWQHACAVKGAGVDCGLFVCSVYVAVGILCWSMLYEGKRPHYASDFAMHRSEERFKAAIALFADPVDQPQPGDVAAWQYGRCFSHAGIVVDWPRIIHAYMPCRMVTLDDASTGEIAERPALFFSRIARMRTEA
jgi:cell wall-associated NlpC family hydrolase